MADRVMPGPVNREAVIREAVSINTRKIFDSCRDKDCIDDLRVFPTVTSQNYIENALSIRPRRAELLYCAVNVEPISFNRGYYTVDCTYFYRVTGETFPGCLTIQGLAVFDKRAMLFGSEGSIKTFSSVGDGVPVEDAIKIIGEEYESSIRRWYEWSCVPPDFRGYYGTGHQASC